ncbi:MAG: LexA family transcriptional regulator [Planctomycetes bacterium]|nr:LexA family transcriptional regulator [Planctomycetota bacterium]
MSGSHFHSESSGEGGAAPSTLGDLLREARRRRGMTLAQVAEVVGCARSYLSELESGKRPPPSDEIVGALERALGVQPGTFADAAAWGRTPGRVKHTVWRLSQQAERASRAREELMARLSKMKGLDAALKSGELRELIEQLSPGEERMQMVSTRDVPLINKVAAGYPREFTDLGYPARVADEYVRCPEVTDADAFAARVVGDSMMPEYREGDVVVFSPMRDVKDGNDCFVRLERDAETTFKRVYFEEEGRLRLQPLNAKYPARILEREEIGGLYVAVSVIRKVGG